MRLRGGCCTSCKVRSVQPGHRAGDEDGDGGGEGDSDGGSLIGTFAETTSPEHQMHWIIENCKTVRAADGVTVIVDALKLLSVKHEKIA